MTKNCPNCNAPYAEGGVFKEANLPIDAAKVKIVNFSLEQNFAHLCAKCAGNKVDLSARKIQDEISELSQFLVDRVTWFPMFTIDKPPERIDYKLKSMVTCNVTVGTGIVNEMSQGLSDLFGSVNTKSGMAQKVNKGEAVARSVIVNRALEIGANAIFAVDIDYGITTNNAATVNIQGTAIRIGDLSQLLDTTELQQAQSFAETVTRLIMLKGLLKSASM